MTFHGPLVASSETEGTETHVCGANKTCDTLDHTVVADAFQVLYSEFCGTILSLLFVVKLNLIRGNFVSVFLQEVHNLR